MPYLQILQCKQVVKWERTDEASSNDGDTCGFDWECTLNNDHDEDDDVMKVGRDVTMHCKLDRISAAVDPGAAENVLPTNLCVQCRSRQRRDQMHAISASVVVEREKNESGMSTGRTAKSTWQVADVKRPLMSVAELIAAVQCVHFDKSVRREPLGQERCDREHAALSSAGPSPSRVGAGRKYREKMKVRLEEARGRGLTLEGSRMA